MSLETQRMIIEELSTRSDSEIADEIIRRKDITTQILDGAHPYYPVHILSTNPSKNTSIVSLFLSENNTMTPFIYSDDSIQAEELWFKIINSQFPFFSKAKDHFKFQNRNQRNNAKQFSKDEQFPLVSMGVNTNPHSELSYESFAHHYGYSATEAFEIVRDVAMNALQMYHPKILNQDWTKNIQ